LCEVTADFICTVINSSHSNIIGLLDMICLWQWWR